MSSFQGPPPFHNPPQGGSLGGVGGTPPPSADHPQRNFKHKQTVGNMGHLDCHMPPPMGNPNMPHSMRNPNMPHSMGNPNMPHSMGNPNMPHSMGNPNMPHSMGNPNMPHSMGHPNMSHSMGNPNMPHSMGNPNIPHSMGNPNMPHSMGNPNMPHSMGNPNMPHSMGNPNMPHSMGNPNMPHSMAKPNMSSPMGNPNMCLPHDGSFHGGMPSSNQSMLGNVRSPRMGNPNMFGPPSGVSAGGGSAPNSVAGPPVQPNQTIYINNINDRIKTTELKKNLRSMFKQFGEIRDIITMNSFWRRGQAWIVFDSIESACRAMTGMQGFVYHGQKMRIAFALEKSDVISKEDGTFVPRPGGPKKPRAVREREEKQKAIFNQMQQQFLQQMQPSQPANMSPNGNANAPSASASSRPNANSSASSGSPAIQINGSMSEADKQNLIAVAQARAAEAASDGGRSNALRPIPARPLNVMGNFQAASMTNESALSNTTLFVEGLPEGGGESSVQGLFGSLKGVTDVRVIPSRRVAFVDFQSDVDAVKARQTLQSFSLGGSRLSISFARK